MRIFVLGAGATGSLLVKFLARQGHQVSSGDRDLERAHHFLGAKSVVPIKQVNARDIWSILRAARGTQLLVNACPPYCVIAAAAATLHQPESAYFSTTSQLRLKMRPPPDDAAVMRPSSSSCWSAGYTAPGLGRHMPRLRCSSSCMIW